MKKKIISDKILIHKILKEHWHTLYKNNENQNKEGKESISIKDVFTFFIIPLIVSIILSVIFGKILRNDANNAILTCLAIVTPLMLSLLILIYEISQKIVERKIEIEYEEDVTEDPEIKGEIKEKLNKIDINIKHVKEIKANISFTILIAMLTIFLLIINAIFMYSTSLNILNTFLIEFNTLPALLSFFIYYCLGILALTTLMVLKRINSLLEDTLKN